VGLASSKTVEIVAPKSSLTPCILDDVPAQLEMLSAVIAEMGYEAIPTSKPEKALKLVRSGHCRLVLADLHIYRKWTDMSSWIELRGAIPGCTSF
jgi:CheY-like chemotaxis protein